MVCHIDILLSYTAAKLPAVQRTTSPQSCWIHVFLTPPKLSNICLGKTTVNREGKAI